MENILLVDDNKTYIAIIKFWLDAQGYKTTAVNSGADALVSLKASTPDIIFLDINMPEMDGIETLRRIRADNKNIPVIMVTAHGNLDQFKEAETLGIVGFFPKDEEFTKAAELIKKALEKI